MAAAATHPLNIAEKVYEVIVVNQEAKDLLETTTRIIAQLETAKTLRGQKADSLTEDEKAMIDRTLCTTENAIHGVASLVEPANVNMDRSEDRVRLSARTHFVFRDLAHIPVSQSRLSIAGSNLNMALSVLCNKASHYVVSRARSPFRQTAPSPPTYQESEWLHASRHRNLRKRASAITTTGSRSSLCGSVVSCGSLAELADTSAARTSTSIIAELEAEPVMERPSICVVESVEEWKSTPTKKDGLPTIDDRFCPTVIEHYGKMNPPIVIHDPLQRPAALVGRARSRSWMEFHSRPH